MSQENLEIVRRVYDAMNTRDPTAGPELMHADVEWIPDSRVGVGPVRGRDNVIRFMLDQAEMFEETHLGIERFWEKDDRVLVFVHATGRGRGSGAPFEIRIAHLWTVRNGLVTGGEGYANRDEALEAAGLSEEDAHADS